MMSKEIRGGRRAMGGLAALAACALFAGCAGPHATGPHATGTHATGRPRESAAGRFCGDARQAAALALGSPLVGRVTSPAADDSKCVLTGRAVRVTVESQAGMQAYTEFDTEVSHQDQVYGPLHQPGQIPAVITVPGSTAAVWIQAQKLLAATSAAPGTSGAYVTVAVSGPGVPLRTALHVAEATARAALAVRAGGSRLRVTHRPR